MGFFERRTGYLPYDEWHLSGRRYEAEADHVAFHWAVRCVERLLFREEVLGARWRQAAATLDLGLYVKPAQASPAGAGRSNIQLGFMRTT